jgi:tetratricopeptide (TPR) repeat protein
MNTLVHIKGTKCMLLYIWPQLSTCPIRQFLAFSRCYITPTSGTNFALSISADPDRSSVTIGINDMMSYQEHIQSLAKEAELYRTQGLYENSREKYKQLLQFIEQKQFHGYEGIADQVRNKIQTVDEDLVDIEQETDKEELANDTQEMIKDLFSVARTKEAARIEGALALAGFGQYDRALREFEELLIEGVLPVVAAKNILRCHMELSSPDKAVEQFTEWVSSSNVLSEQELNLIRAFLKQLLKEKHIERRLPKLSFTSQASNKAEEEEISAINVQLKNGPRKGDNFEFKVTSQSGNIISVDIPERQRDVADAFRIGLQLPELQCYSPIAVFKASGIVIRKTRHSNGKKKGGYMLDISLDDE